MRDYFGYAMGDFGCNMSFALITNYLMLFYTQYIGLRLSDWAWIIVVGKVWDAINDPLIGGMVDNVRIGKGTTIYPNAVLMVGRLYNGKCALRRAPFVHYQ